MALKLRATGVFQFEGLNFVHLTQFRWFLVIAKEKKKSKNEFSTFIIIINTSSITCSPLKHMLEHSIIDCINALYLHANNLHMWWAHLEKKTSSSY